MSCVIFPQHSAKQIRKRFTTGYRMRSIAMAGDFMQLKLNPPESSSDMSGYMKSVSRHILPPESKLAGG